jgi:hypothetical protein
LSYRQSSGAACPVARSGVRQFCIQPVTPVFVGETAVYQDIAPILCYQPDEIYEALPLASRSQDDRGHDTLVVLKAEDVSGQIGEAASSFFSRACGKIAVDTVHQPRSKVGHIRIMARPDVSSPGTALLTPTKRALVSRTVLLSLAALSRSG